MNRRSIAIQLMRKHEEFVGSIKDPKIKEIVRNQTIISGGCIASMLLNEKVNDYDYYFTSKEAVLAVAKYYCSLFIKEREQRGEIDKRCTTPVVYTEKDGKKVKDGESYDRVRIKVQSAGIVGLNTKSGKYRFFETMTDGEEQGSEYIEDAMEGDLPPVEDLIEEGDKVDSVKLDEGQEKYQPVYISDNAITLSDKIQLVIRFFGTPKEIHSNFDYIHCTNYFVPKACKLVLTKLAMESLLARELKYVGSLYPVCSVIRLRKFLGNGWHINAGQLLKICLQLSKLKLEDISVLEDQLTGVDTAYFAHMLSILKQKQEDDKDFIPDMPYVVSLIDKIFG